MSAQPPYPPPSAPPGYPPPRSAGRGWIIAAVILALIIIGGAGYWLGGRNTAATPDAVTPVPSASPGAASAASASYASELISASASASDATGAAATTTRVAPTTTVTPSPTPTTPTTTPASHPDPDFGYVTAVTLGAVNKITFDRATLYTGAAAASAAKAHGKTVEDDYFIVDDNPLLRTFELSASLVVTGSSDLSGDVGPKPSTLAAVKAWIEANPKGHLPVDLSYDGNGHVTKIAEVFFP